VFKFVLQRSQLALMLQSLPAPMYLVFRPIFLDPGELTLELVRDCHPRHPAVRRKSDGNAHTDTAGRNEPAPCTNGRAPIGLDRKKPPAQQPTRDLTRDLTRCPTSHHGARGLGMQATRFLSRGGAAVCRATTVRKSVLPECFIFF
jgi:hypothetical protein